MIKLSKIRACSSNRAAEPAQMRIGCLAYDAAWESRSGRVVSRFARAANIRLNTGSLVAFLSAGLPMHPWAISPIGDLSSLVVGMEASIEDQTLMVGPVTVPFSGAQIIDLTITARPARCLPVATLCSLESWLGQSHGENGSPEAAAQAQIAAALRSFASRRDVTPLTELVGLGFGLTPSCDDVLMGVLAALDFMREAAPATCAVRQRLVHALPRDLEQRTSLVSAQMLRAAASGRYPEPVVELTQALRDRDASLNEIRSAADRVRALGHRSGNDILLGFLKAVRLATHVQGS